MTLDMDGVESFKELTLDQENAWRFMPKAGEYRFTEMFRDTNYVRTKPGVINVPTLYRF